VSDPTVVAAGELAVRCRGLTKRFGDGGTSVLAVDRLDLDVPRGSVFGLLGPNGAGKTTTLRMITGLARPTAGSVMVDGRTIAVDRPTTRGSIGVLDQSPRFYGWMRGRELVELAGRLSGLDARAAARRTPEVLDRVGLGDAGRRRIGGYSGGMRQRLGIAAALVAEPPLLVLDEPVSSLDPVGRRDLLGLIADMRETATVLFSTHVLDDVERICDRVGILAAGRLVTEAPLQELLRRYAGSRYRIEVAPGQTAGIEALRTTLSAAPWCESVRVEDPELVVAITDEDAAAIGLLPLIAGTGVRIERFERARPTLEEVFLTLVQPDDREAIA
jgi:ABC-2 type transport system ATP-binding protein